MRLCRLKKVIISTFGMLREYSEIRLASERGGLDDKFVLFGCCYLREALTWRMLFARICCFFLRPCAPLNVSNLAVWTNIFRKNNLLLLAVNPP